MTARKTEPKAEPSPGVAVHHHAMTLAPGVVHAVCPGRPGDGVLTYTAGQRMPDWLLAELEDGGRLVPEAEGVWTLELAH